jgi:hypothetical protein
MPDGGLTRRIPGPHDRPQHDDGDDQRQLRPGRLGRRARLPPACHGHPQLRRRAVVPADAAAHAVDVPLGTLNGIIVFKTSVGAIMAMLGAMLGSPAGPTSAGTLAARSATVRAIGPGRARGGTPPRPIDNAADARAQAEDVVPGGRAAKRVDMVDAATVSIRSASATTAPQLERPAERRVRSILRRPGDRVVSSEPRPTGRVNTKIAPTARFRATETSSPAFVSRRIGNPWAGRGRRRGSCGMSCGQPAERPAASARSATADSGSRSSSGRGETVAFAPAHASNPVR